MSERGTTIEVPTSRLGRLRSATGLAPVQRRRAWVAWGIFAQLVAIASPVAWVVVRAKHEAVTGLAARVTVLAAARESLHTRTGLIILGESLLLFAVGSVLVARPFVRSLGMLLVAVPLAAIVGVLVLGALALVVAVVVALISLNVDLPGGGGAGATSRKAKPTKGRPG
jgi:hypothetical protein